MGRKRGGDSSDDDFHLPEGSQSPSSSRLKRPRRRSAREHTSLSPHPSSFQDDKDDVIFVPDSLEDEENDGIVLGSTENSVANVAEADSVAKLSVAIEDDDEYDDMGSPLPNFRRASRQSNDNIALPSALPENEDDSKMLNDMANSAPGSVPASDDTKSPEHDNNNGDKIDTRRNAAKRKRYVMSDSEHEDSLDEDNADADDDDDAFKSDAELLDEEEDDAESDFEPSPKKSTRKKASPRKQTARAAAKKPRLRATSSRKKTAIEATRSTTVQKVSGAATATETSVLHIAKSGSATKKRLGARIPIRSVGLGRSSGLQSDANKGSNGQAQLNSARGATSSTPAPRFRSGLSRKASVPRLHSYLPRK